MLRRPADPHGSFRAARFGVLLLLGWAALGCQRSTPLEYVAGPQVQELSPELQALVNTTLAKYAGTSTAPRLIGAETHDAQHLKHGALVYKERCLLCHGASGDGAGPAAEYLQPRPRDYRRGIFKFTSTPYGGKPRREDLIRTVRRGIYGTSMPSFALLSEEDLRAVVDYVLVLTHRGELEVLLAAEAEASEELPDDVVQPLIDSILEQWKQSNAQQVDPLTKMPEATDATIAAGKQAFLTKGCSKCHGEDGRGQTRENIGTDSWGQVTSAADLTSGLLHGGTQPLDIYRRIYSGINGTPMPSFRDALSPEPDTLWNLVHYVEHVSGQRRRGDLPPVAVGMPAAAAPSGEAAPEATPESPDAAATSEPTPPAEPSNGAPSPPADGEAPAETPTEAPADAPPAPTPALELPPAEPAPANP